MGEMRSPGALDAMIAPRSIAVVGASNDPATINGRSVAYLKAAFKGPVFPIHPSHDQVQGLVAHPMLSDLDEVPDLVIVAVRAEIAVPIAEEAASIGVPALLVFSSGFSEIGNEGARLQTQLLEIVRGADMRLFGPNCLGFMNIPDGIFATFAEVPDPHAFSAGGIALVSQSGAFGAMVFKAAQRERIGISYFAGTGNEADLSMTELLGYFIERDDVHTVMAFGEQVADPDRFLTVAQRARELDKPIVFMKVGSSTAGARAAVSHTGSMAGSDDVIDTVFRQYGVIRARTMQDLLDYARIFEHRRRPTGRRVAVVSISGGVGVLLADAASDAGLEVPRFEGDEVERVAATIPSFGSATNPVDCTAQVGVSDRAALRRVLQTVSSLESVDMLCYGGLSDVPSEDWLSAVETLRTDSDKPGVVWCSTPEAQQLVSGRGVPCFLHPDGAMRALAALATFSLDRHEMAPPMADRTDAAAAARTVLRAATRPVLSERDSRAVLGAFGLPVGDSALVTTPDDAAAESRRLGYPVACKVASPDIPHKSDVGGVILALRDAEEVRAAYATIMENVEAAAPHADIEGIIVQPMAPAGLELVVGLHRDEQFGPIVTVGLGGTETEIVRRTTMRRAPVDAKEMRRALGEIADGRLVTDRRGLSEAHITEVASIAARLGDLAVALPEVTEVDINPLVVGPQGSVIADALLAVNRTSRE